MINKRATVQCENVFDFSHEVDDVGEGESFAFDDSFVVHDGEVFEFLVGLLFGLIKLEIDIFFMLLFSDDFSELVFESVFIRSLFLFGQDDEHDFADLQFAFSEAFFLGAVDPVGVEVVDGFGGVRFEEVLLIEQTKGKALESLVQ